MAVDPVVVRQDQRGTKEKRRQGSFPGKGNVWEFPSVKIIDRGTQR